MENFNVLTSGGIVDQDLVMDGWTEIIRNLISMANFRARPSPARSEAAAHGTGGFPEDERHPRPSGRDC